MITEDSFLDFKCPGCGEVNSFPNTAAGLVRECVHCMESVLVPADGSDLGHSLPLPVTTPRLVLRRFTSNDWQALVGFMFEDEHEVLKWLEVNARTRLSNLNENFYLAVELRESARVIGHVALRFDDPTFRETEVQFEFREPDQTKEIVTEALTGLLGFCFGGLRLHRVTARAYSSDPARCTAFESAGMRREGEFVKNHHWEGEWHNTIWFAMLAEEFHPAGGNQPEAGDT